MQLPVQHSPSDSHGCDEFVQQLPPWHEVPLQHGSPSPQAELSGTQEMHVPLLLPQKRPLQQPTFAFWLHLSPPVRQTGVQTPVPASGVAKEQAKSGQHCGTPAPAGLQVSMSWAQQRLS